jgi:glycine/D-amino acid oxidase-like deaminating enzyme
LCQQLPPETPYDPTLVMISDILQISGVKGAKAAITVTAVQLWPYKFVTGLLAKLIKRTSINVQTHTRVTSVSSDQDGSHIISTPRGVIRAKKVIFATNAYTSGIAPAYYQKIVPTKASCSHVRVPKDAVHPPPHLTHTYGLSYSNGYRDYLIPRPDNGVICGGGKHTYGDQKELWFNTCDDSTVVEATRKHFETVMQENFVGWERSGAEVDYLWAGSKCISFPEAEKQIFSKGS